MPPIVFSPNAEKDFRKLNIINQKKVYKKVKTLKSAPLAGKLLSGKLKGIRSLRAWPYRIIYEIGKEQVNILQIIHRQAAYK